ncbi:MAG: dihydrolipoyllysine-residue acetyltransferase [Candidatus Eremiobacteraeota bacterium]|nr:dihydrolipoyllysine-residue acetyltransferase [Candidatus Eremiobacteraeota bacterium]
MSDIVVRVPDIGDFQGVPVIEVLVKPGERVEKDTPLITLESEKASMEVPAPSAGVVRSLDVGVGDRVSQGSQILTLADDRAPADNVDESAQVMEAPDPSAQSAHAPPSTLVEARVPDIGDFKDVPVIEVLVKSGDRVAKDGSLIVLESEKATMEVPSPADGVVRELAVKAGDRVSQGSLIAKLESATPGARPDSAPPSPGEARQPQRAVVAPEIAAAALPSVDGRGNGAIHASPAIRRFARELGVDLHGVSGSGPHGRVTREDVQRFVRRALEDGGATAGAGLGLAPWPKLDFTKFGPTETRQLSRIKRISGPNLHRNWVMIPHVTNNDDADVTELEAFRKTLNAEHERSGTKVTMLAFLIKACVASLKEFPDFNASLDGENLILKRYYHIGFAADTPQGLTVPVIKDADQKGILDIARETAELAAKARDGKLQLAEMQGGTFTISSLGGIGGTYFTPIINAPEVAILGVCRARTMPVWNGKEFQPRLMLPLSLSYDHRVIDGALAARFNSFLASLLADMRRAIL